MPETFEQLVARVKSHAFIPPEAKGTVTMKTLKKFEFTSPSDRVVYDWEKLLDGGIYQLTEGEDYTCKAQTVRMMAYKQAASRGQTVKVAAIEGGLVLQAQGEPDEAKGAEYRQQQRDLAAKRRAAHGAEAEAAGDEE